MTPRMIQAMEILQLPIRALRERIEQEKMENPLLEEQDPERRPEARESVETNGEPPARPAEKPLDAKEQLIHLYNPKPGRDSEPVATPPVPDISAEQNESGKYVVRLENTPRLNIDHKYQQLLDSGQADQKTREYIQRKIQSAKWLIESIEQRHNMLKRVTQTIVDRQTAFLDKGPEHIVPLQMQQIADVIGVDVATVSRAVDDKYMETPRGIFPLTRFFGGG